MKTNKIELVAFSSKPLPEVPEKDSEFQLQDDYSINFLMYRVPTNVPCSHLSLC